MDTREIVKKYNFKFSKSLGQNFLCNEETVNDIVKKAEVSKDDIVIEIGPGVGTMTEKLLNAAKFVYAVEIDKNLIQILNNEFNNYDNLKIIEGDALKIDFSKIVEGKKNVKVVANLPYYIATPIVIRLIKNKYGLKSITVMVQKELGERFEAKPCSKAYGEVSVLMQYLCNVKIVKNVPSSMFIPKPKVDSVVVRLDMLEKPPVHVDDEKLFEKVVKNAFAMRRKTLYNALLRGMKIEGTKLKEILKISGIDPKRRGETLTIKEFANLSDNIKKYF